MFPQNAEPDNIRDELHKDCPYAQWQHMHQFNRTQDVSLISPHNAAECKILEYPEIISDQNHVSGNSVRTWSTSDTPVSIVLSDIASGDIDSTVSW